MNKLLLGDCIKKMQKLKDNSITAIVTDPPYELGFMGKKWDNSGIAYSVEMWKQALRVLKPGGHLLSFSGTRTYHRMTCAIEDAGFEIRDMLEWIYASGFPKSHNIGKAVDKKMGNEREEADYIAPDGKKRWGGNSFSVNKPPDGRGVNKRTKGNSEWEGWGSATKPAHEPILWAMKPLTAVPDNSIIEVGLLLNLLLCQTLNVELAERFLELNQAELKKQNSVQWLVSKLNTIENEEQLPKTGMFKSQETKRIFWNIVLLWNSILEENYLNQNTPTTKTEISKTIDWKTLKLLLLAVIYQNTTQAKEFVVSGKKQSAWNVKKYLKEGLKNWKHTQIVFAEESVLIQMLKESLNELVCFAEKSLTTPTLKENTVRQAVIINQGGSVSHEPIVLARKPLSEKTIADNCLKHGTGGINIDGTRIPYKGETPNIGGRAKHTRGEGYGFKAQGDEAQANTDGRFPANLISTDNALDDGEVRKTGNITKDIDRTKSKTVYKDSFNQMGVSKLRHTGDSGSFNRYFDIDQWFEQNLKNLPEKVQKVYPMLICPKASKKERNAGCEGLEAKASGHRGNFRCTICGYQKSSGSPCKCENPIWEEIPLKPQSNNHPTVKPIHLISWLITLVSKEGDTILDPFCGSGSTLVSAKMLNRNYIGIDMTPEYIEICKARLNAVPDKLL